MKKLLLLFCCAFSILSLLAQDLPSGFYRVKNKGEGRYLYVTDNTGTATASTQDLRAVQANLPSDRILVDPACVMYARHYSGVTYDVESQGTSVYGIIKKYPEIRYEERAKAYRVGAKIEGTQFYLGCNNDPDDEIGFITTKDASGDKALWLVEAINEDDDKNYFGIQPTIEINGKYYQPFYAEFAFSFYSKGMKAYYISETNGKEAKIMEVKSEIIPAQTPVIIECSSKNPSDNRLKLFAEGGTPISDNILKGNFFCNGLRHNSATTKFDSKTMRVLGVTENGTLGFVSASSDFIVKAKYKGTANVDCLKANIAYLKVDASAATVIEAKNESEYSSIEIISQDKEQVKGVYSILGVKLSDTTDMSDLPAGIYIVDGKKIVKR